MQSVKQKPASVYMFRKLCGCGWDVDRESNDDPVEATFRLTISLMLGVVDESDEQHEIIGDTKASGSKLPRETVSISEDRKRTTNVLRQRSRA